EAPVGLHEALALHPPGLASAGFEEGAGHQHAELPPQVVLRGRRSVRVERVALEQDRVGHAKDAVEAHPGGLAFGSRGRRLARRSSKNRSSSARTASPPSNPLQLRRTMAT